MAEDQAVLGVLDRLDRRMGPVGLKAPGVLDCLDRLDRRMGPLGLKAQAAQLGPWGLAGGARMLYHRRSG